jgi:hypothetical protein
MEENIIKLIEEVDRIKERIITLETGLSGYTDNNGLYKRVQNIENKLDEISRKISLTEGILKGLGIAWIVLQILDKIVPMMINK